mgnify:CR=1 FL=1
MSQIDINQVLSQMRGMAAAAKIGTGTEGVTATDSGGQFGRLLAESMDKVNEAQQQAKTMQASFVRGESNVDLPSVMVAMQEANISFQAMTQVRNRLLSAYQEIMNMPV